MKKFEIVVIIVSLFLASCGEDTKNLSVLESKRRELIFSQKEALKKYKKDLFSLDSVINSHPDNKEKTVAIKTIPITVKKVEVKTFEHFLLSVLINYFARFRYTQTNG